MRRETMFARSRHRTKMLGLLLAAAAVMLLATACGSSSSNSSNRSGSNTGTQAAANATSTSGKGITIGFVELDAEPQSVQMQHGIQAAAAEVGAKVTVTGPTAPNPTTEVANLQQMTTSGVKGILVTPYSAQQFERPINTAVADGIDVDTIDIASPGSRANFNVGVAQKEPGIAGADAMANKLGPGAKGTIVSGICAPGIPKFAAQETGFTTEMTKREPGVTVKTATTALADAPDFAAWQRIVAQNSGALGFFGMCTGDVPAFIKLKQLNPGSKWLDASVIGGETPTTWTAIRNGGLTAVVEQRGFVQGYVAAKLMLDHLINHTTEPKGWIDSGFDLMTQTNINAIAAALSSNKGAESYYAGLLSKLTNNPPVINPMSLEQTEITTNLSHTGSNVK